MKNFLFFSILFLTLCGCRSRKTSIDTTHELKQQDSTSIVQQHQKLLIENKTNKAVVSNLSEKIEIIEYDGIEGDTLQIEKRDASGNITSFLKIKGKGKLKLSSFDKSDFQSILEQSSIENQIHKSSISKTSVEKKVSLKNQKKATDRTGFSFMNWLWIALLICVFYFLNKKYKWIGGVTGLFFL